MDLKKFLTELLSALAKLDFVKDVDLKTESIILSGQVILKENMFIEVYCNTVTETIAFALIKENQRIWGIDRDNIRDWHIHPLNNPKMHIAIKPLSVSEIIEDLAKILEEI